MIAKSIILSAAAVIACASTTVQADFVLTMDDTAVGGTEVIVADGQLAGFITDSGLVTTHADADGLMDGAVSFSGAVPGSVFNVNATVGISKPNIGSTALGRIDLASINVSGTGAGMLSIGLTDTDFNNTGLIGYEALIGGTTDGNVDFMAMVDNANQEFGNSDSVSQAGFGPGAFSSTLLGSETFAGDYSLSLLVDITHTAASQVTDFDAILTVPGPGGLALAGLGLLGLRSRRRRAHFS